MKRLNPIQVAASAAGAVLSAVIASFFGVEGTIIGTAIGSIVATTVAALVWESIERGHEAVRQVVVKTAESSSLLHHGSTGAAGEVTSGGAEASAVEAQVDSGMDAEVVAGDGADGSPAVRAVSETAAAGESEVRQQAPADPTRQEQGVPGAWAAGSGGAAGDAGAVGGTTAGGVTGDVTGPTRFLTSSRAGQGTAASTTVPRSSASPVVRRSRVRRPSRRWMIVSVVVVFVISLGVVTVVELIAGQPLSSVVGGSHSVGGTSVFGGSKPSPPATTTPPSTTRPPVSSSTTSTTAPVTSTTTTTTPLTSASSTTTTTTPTTTSTTTPVTSTAPSSAGTGGASSSGDRSSTAGAAGSTGG